MAYEAWRELPENDVQFFFQPLCVLRESQDGIFTVMQLFDVSDIPASLNGEDKPLGRPLVPPFKYRFLDKSVESHIELDGIEFTAVVFEPPALWDILRVKNPLTPM